MNGWFRIHVECLHLPMKSWTCTYNQKGALHKLPHFSFIELWQGSEWEKRNREKERECLTNLPDIKQKARDLCRKFFDFRKSSFLLLLHDSSGGCPGGVYSFNAKHTNTQSKHSVVEEQKRNCFLIMERRRRVREVFIDFPICFNPEKKVFYFRSFSVVNDFFLVAAVHNTIMNIKGTWNSLSTHTPSCEWYQFRFSDRLHIGGVSLALLVCLFSAPRVLQSN